MLQLVLVDGIGGKQVFRGAFFRHFEERGHRCHYFGYQASKESLNELRLRLVTLLHAVANTGPYVLVGYSFGGILSRIALEGTEPGKQPQRLFLVASPFRSLAMCRPFGNWWLFRTLTGEAGKLVASDTGMCNVASATMPTTCIYGKSKILGLFNFAGASPSDGMVSVNEVCPNLYADSVSVSCSHPFIATAQPTLEAISTRLHSVASGA
jgi:Thioesterase domain